MRFGSTRSAGSPPRANATSHLPRSLPPERQVAFSLEEITVVIEDLMRIADDLTAGGDEVNAFLVDQVVNQLLDRAFGSDG